MKRFDIKIAAIAVLFSAAAFVLQVVPASAQSVCKGQAKGKCTSNTSCSWVGGYKTKAGNSVKAYCRSTSKGAAKKSDATKLKKAKGKTDGTKKSAKAEAVKKTRKAKTANKATKANMGSKVRSADEKAKK